MENRINIAELLKNCPHGMELDCVLFDDSVKVIFDKVDETLGFVKILVIRKHNRVAYSLTKYGQWDWLPYHKCVIYPKGKTTWEGFQSPFKDGDIVTNQNNIGTWIGIYHKYDCLNETFSSYCYIRRDGGFCANSDKGHGCYKTRLATEEEKQRLFDAIKTNGYKWNTETKTLEELPKFKPGDVLVSESGNLVLLSHIDSENIVHYHCIIPTYGSFRIEENTAVGVGKCYDCVLANEQQRQRMYDKIKSSGYEYNQSTNKMKKVDEPGFKDGDIVFSGKDLISIFKRLSPSKSLHSYV